MPRPATPNKKPEASAVYVAFLRAQQAGLVRSQSELARELDLHQPVISAWMCGRSPIPDKWLLWLGKRLDFDAYAVRPSLEIYKEIV